jgi:hypothetical protein
VSQAAAGASRSGITRAVPVAVAMTAGDPPLARLGAGGGAVLNGIDLVAQLPETQAASWRWAGS